MGFRALSLERRACKRDSNVFVLFIICLSSTRSTFCFQELLARCLDLDVLLSKLYGRRCYAALLSSWGCSLTCVSERDFVDVMILQDGTMKELTTYRVVSIARNDIGATDDSDKSPRQPKRGIMGYGMATDDDGTFKKRVAFLISPFVAEKVYSKCVTVKELLADSTCSFHQPE